MTEHRRKSRGQVPDRIGTSNELESILDGIAIGRTFARYRRRAVLYSQDDPADSLIYLKKGRVKLTILSPSGREGTIAIVDQGKLLGEGCLAGQAVRMETATAMTDSSIIRIDKASILSVIEQNALLSMRLLDYALARSILLEENLIDQLLNSSEKRLARLLLSLSHFDAESEKSESFIPLIGQKTLAEMIGASRERVNFFMRKFRQRGYIEYDHGICVRRTLFSVLLRE